MIFWKDPTINKGETPASNVHTVKYTPAAHFNFKLANSKKEWLCGTLSLIPSLLTSLSLCLSPASSLLFKLRWADKQIKSVTSCLHEPERKSISSAMLVSQSSNHTSTPWQPRVGGGGGLMGLHLLSADLPSVVPVSGHSNQGSAPLYNIPH